jgi:hypothetical protein
MNHPILISLSILLAFSAWSQANTPADPDPISPKEMLLTGPTPMKLHALSRIVQISKKEGLDESYLPGLKVSAEEKDDLMRHLTAKLLGENFVEGKETPNPEAVALLTKLAKDDAQLVRYSASYYGLTLMEVKTPEIIELLIDVAAADRDTILNERIAKSLENYRDEAKKILDQKLKSDNPLSYFEIYELLSGKKPDPTRRILEIPSTKPIMFVFFSKGEQPAKFRADVEKELKNLGLENPEMYDRGAGDDYVVMLKTYVTRDRVTVEDAFANHGMFAPPQVWWLTAELEIQFEEWRNK